MPKLDLFTVFSAALENCHTPTARVPETTAPIAVPSRAPAASRSPMPDPEALLNALRNSATGRDQLMQRRLGTLLEPEG